MLSYLTPSVHGDEQQMAVPYPQHSAGFMSYGFGFYDELTDSTRVPYPLVHTTKRVDPNIDVKLEHLDLWKRFAKLNLEMIITKTGRRMFPTFKVSITGLDPTSRYIVYMDVVPVDYHRYKYHSSQWIVTGAAEPHLSGRFYPHPDSNSTGAQLMKQPLSFSKLKLTNNATDQNGHIVLNSMHKYIPRLHIVATAQTFHGDSQFFNDSTDHVNTFVFPETQFIAVTAYQNENVTRLKIDHNPFAKGFRENNGHTLRKDPRSAKRQLDADDEHQGFPRADMYQTPETSKRSRTSFTEEDYTPLSRMVPTGDQSDSIGALTDSYEHQFPSNFCSSPYFRFPPTYAFPYTPMGSTPSTGSPLAFAAAMAASHYSFSSPYGQYSSLS